MEFPYRKTDVKHISGKTNASKNIYSLTKFQHASKITSLVTSNAVVLKI